MIELYGPAPGVVLAGRDADVVALALALELDFDEDEEEDDGATVEDEVGTEEGELDEELDWGRVLVLVLVERGVEAELDGVELTVELTLAVEDTVELEEDDSEEPMLEDDAVVGTDLRRKSESGLRHPSGRGENHLRA